MAQAGPLTKPLGLLAELTHRCPLGCPYCSNPLKLDPRAVGTLLNLAMCKETTKRYATAWGMFREVATKSRGTRQDRVELAQQRERALAPRLSSIALDVAAPRAPGLAITIDGIALAEAAWSSALPLDGGLHTIEATAPDLIVTFGPDGMTNHPDHRAISAWATDAWRAARPSADLWYATLGTDFYEQWGALSDHVGLFVEQPSPPCTSDGDLAARLGGDEFGVLLPGSDLRSATAVARRMLTSLAEPILIDGQPVTMRASIGIADGSRAGATGPELLREADVAMYAAKASGKDRAAAFVPEMLAPDLDPLPPAGPSSERGFTHLRPTTSPG